MLFKDYKANRDKKLNESEKDRELGLAATLKDMLNSATFVIYPAAENQDEVTPWIVGEDQPEYKAIQNVIKSRIKRAENTASKSSSEENKIIIDAYNEYRNPDDVIKHKSELGIGHLEDDQIRYVIGDYYAAMSDSETPSFVQHLAKRNGGLYYLNEEENMMVDENVRLFEEEYDGKLSNLDEGFFGKLLGGAAGFLVGPSIGRIIARALGIEKGILYDMFNSRLVGAALGAAIAKAMGNKGQTK